MSQSQDDNQPLFGTSGPLGTRLQNDAAIPQEQILQGLRSVKEFNENYIDLTPIGQGGMGQVFQAWDQRFERFVAIKQILTSSVGDPSAVSRFLRESRIVGSFNHPNIIIVYDRGESPLGPYLVMEFASGGNLASLCEKGPLDVKSVVEYGMQICEALTCIHNAGIIHRDIKPQNILLQPYRLNQPMVAKLADFGLAYGESHSLRSQIIQPSGTVYYRSPESMTVGKSVDARSDIYGLGVTLYHLVTGVVPTQMRIDKVPEPIRSILDKATEQDPSLRYATAQEMYDELAVSLTRLTNKSSDTKIPLESVTPATTISPAEPKVSNEAPNARVVDSRPPVIPSKRRLPKTPWIASLVVLLAIALIVWLSTKPNWERFSTVPSELENEPRKADSPEPTPASPSAATPASESKKEVPTPTSEGNPVTKDQPQVGSKTTQSLPNEFTNSLGMEFRLIQPGTFTMGSPLTPEQVHQRYPGGKPEYYEEETQHQVTFTKPIYIGIHEVTVGQFRKFVEAEGYKTDAERDGKGGYGYDSQTNKFVQDSKYSWRNPGFQQDDNHPVVNVSWNDAVAFCEWLSRVDGRDYRLPTEAQWEYACRAGSSFEFTFGDDAEQLADFGNISDASLKSKFPSFTGLKANDGSPFTSGVGSYRPNKFGLHDIHGNAYEWCSDWYGAYPTGSLTDPMGPSTGSYRVLRGGSWCYGAASCRSSFRDGGDPSSRDGYLGFRLALSSTGTFPVRGAE